MENWQYKYIIFCIICAFIIGFPYFKIDYFDITATWKLTAKFFLLPIFIFLLYFGPKFYLNKVKPLDKFTPKTKEKTRDFVSMTIMIIYSTVVFLAITFSFIIVINVFIGKSETVSIKEPIENVKPYFTKNGKLKYSIYFRNPKTGILIDLLVNREYNVGEKFEKEMKYGSLGILYFIE